MLRKSMILFPVALIGAVPFSASAETMDQSELEMFRKASVSIQQAGDAALSARPGRLAAVSFGDEDGRAAYEAVVVGANDESWTVLIDANSGKVFASGKSSAMEDHEDGPRLQDDNDHHDGEGDDD